MGAIWPPGACTEPALPAWPPVPRARACVTAPRRCPTSPPSSTRGTTFRRPCAPASCLRRLGCRSQTCGSCRCGSSCRGWLAGTLPSCGVQQRAWCPASTLPPLPPLLPLPTTAFTPRLQARPWTMSSLVASRCGRVAAAGLPMQGPASSCRLHPAGRAQHHLDMTRRLLRRYLHPAPSSEPSGPGTAPQSGSDLRSTSTSAATTTTSGASPHSTTPPAATQPRVPRVFLVGDAAHCFPPAGEACRALFLGRARCSSVRCSAALWVFCACCCPSRHSCRAFHAFRRLWHEHGHPGRPQPGLEARHGAQHAAHRAWRKQQQHAWRRSPRQPHTPAGVVPGAWQALHGCGLCTAARDAAMCHFNCFCICYAFSYKALHNAPAACCLLPRRRSASPWRAPTRPSARPTGRRRCACRRRWASTLGQPAC